MAYHHVAHILFGFDFRKIAYVNIEDAAFWRTGQSINDGRILKNSQLIHRLNNFMQIAENHLIALIEESRVCVANRVRRDTDFADRGQTWLEIRHRLRLVEIPLFKIGKAHRELQSQSNSLR